MTAGPRPPASEAPGERSQPASPSLTTASHDARSPDWQAVARWAALVLAGAWAGYFLFTGMPQLTLHVFPRTLVLHAMVGGAAFVYVAYLAGARRLPGGTPIDIGVVALIAAYAIGTYTSVNWRVSLEATLQWSIALIAFYALAGLPLLSADGLRRALILVAGALAVYALWIVGNDYADYLRLTDNVGGINRNNIFPPTVPRVHDVSDHTNVLAMIMVLALPFFTLAALRPAAWWERALGIAGFFVAGWALFLTLSRGGWIGAAVAVVFTTAGTWLTLRADAREREGKPLSWETFVPSNFSPTALAAAGGALALAVFGALAFLAKASTRPGWLFRASLSAREDAWRAGRQIWSDHILTGAGPNTFGLLYPSYSKRAGQFIVQTQHAHNGFLQVADDMGLIGLLAIAVLGAAIVFVLWRTWRDGALEQRLLAIACAGALLGFSAHNQLDAGNIWKAVGVALAFVGAIIARNYLESRPARPQPGTAAPQSPAGGPEEGRPGAGALRLGILPPASRYGSLALRAGLLALVAAPLVGWYRIDAAQYDYWQGVEKLNKGEPGAIEKLQAAVNADSSMMVYQLELGVAQVTVYDAGGRTDDPLLQKGIIHLERAAALDPRSELAHANLAVAYARAGRADDAAREAQLTRLADYHVAPVLVAGEVYETLGRDADAISTYGQVISMDAGLANSTFWQGTPFRKQHFAEILKNSSIGINQCVYGAYIVEAHRSDPTSPLDGLDGAQQGCQFQIFTGGLGNDLGTRVALAKILMEQGDLNGALGHLRFAIDRQPDFGPARTELGLLYEAKGDIDAARRQWVLGGELDEPESLRLLGDSYPPGQAPSGVISRLEGLLKTKGSSVQNDIVSVLYYRMRYARISPVFALVPGDWTTAVPRPVAEWRAAVQRWKQAQGG